MVTLPAPLNAVAVAPDGGIVAAGASGKVFFLSPKGELQGEIEATGGADHRALRSRATASWRRPPACAARWPSSTSATRSVQRLLVGPGLPAWSAAFLPDNRTLLTGGSDNLVRRWNAATGERIGEMASPARRTIRWPPTATIRAPGSSAPAWPATR